MYLEIWHKTNTYLILPEIKSFIFRHKNIFWASARKTSPLKISEEFYHFIPVCRHNFHNVCQNCKCRCSKGQHLPLQSSLRIFLKLMWRYGIIWAVKHNHFMYHLKLWHLLSRQGNVTFYRVDYTQDWTKHAKMGPKCARLTILQLACGN